MEIQSRDYLWLNLRELPYFRSLLRAVEAGFYQSIDLPSPVLDIGCGDGHFASVAFERSIDVGLDPSFRSLREANHRRAYRHLLECDGGRMPFPNGFFKCAVSNSVLEHIPHVEQVLAETARVLKPGAPFIFCVPNHRFLGGLSVGRFFDKIGLRFLGNAYRSFFNTISKHHHCDDPGTWSKRLEAANFKIVKFWHYFPPSALAVLEWGHYFGLPSLLMKKLTDHWVLVPARWNLALTEKMIKKYAQPVPHDDGVYTFYITRRG